MLILRQITGNIVDSMSDQAAATAANEHPEFEAAFTRHHRTVFRAARSILQDTALAEDVTQETFIKLFNNLNVLESEEMLRPWLIRVAINLARNTLRTKNRANTRDEKYVKQNWAESSTSIENDFEDREGIEEIRRILSLIKEPQRSCLILKQQGLSYREIAESLSLNEGSIGTYIARARAEFAKLYGKSGEKVL